MRGTSASLPAIVATLACLHATAAGATVIVTAAERSVYAYYPSIAPWSDPILGSLPSELSSTALGTWRHGVFQPAPPCCDTQDPHSFQASYLGRSYEGGPDISLNIDTLIGGSAATRIEGMPPSVAGGAARITFEVTEEPMRLDLLASATFYEADPGVGGRIALELEGAAGSLLRWETTDESVYERDLRPYANQPGWWSERVERTLILPPGSYTVALTLDSDSRGTLYSSRTFTRAELRFFAVPEPATATLLVAGAAALGSRRRRSSRR
jgi:hypothetical protein